MRPEPCPPKHRSGRALTWLAFAGIVLGACAATASLLPGRARHQSLRDVLGIGGAIGNGTSEARDKAGFVLHQLACRAGELRGCVNLGLHYHHGWGVTKDERRATALVEQACAAGDALGCNDLGISFEEGRGIAPDVARAVDLYRYACDRGQAAGCFNLGDMYEKGAGVPMDPSRAIALYAMACDGGWDDGCTALGRLRARGGGQSP